MPETTSPTHVFPHIDHARCEAKRDCVAVCPEGVFAVRRIESADFARLKLTGKLRSAAHRRMTAYTDSLDQCRHCGLCLAACPEGAISMRINDQT